MSRPPGRPARFETHDWDETTSVVRERSAEARREIERLCQEFLDDQTPPRQRLRSRSGE